MQRIIERNIDFKIDFLLKIFLRKNHWENSKNKQADENHLPAIFYLGEVNHKNSFNANRFPSCF